MAQIDQLFKMMVEQGASDLHLRSGSPPHLRLNGNIIRLNYRDLSNDEVQALIFEILSEKHRQEFISRWELDCSYIIEGVGRFRCNVFMQREGLSGVFRLIPEKIKTVKELNLPTNILNLIDSKQGLVLVTGPTGSGKSTTLAALIHEINVNRACHIITIEDPIEFVHQGHKSLINQREVKSHTKSFANALRAALREDPDIILVGEMRDLETVSLAITAAETGHLVFGTLHTNGAAKTVDRIIDIFPPEQQPQIRSTLSEGLRGVISQGLIPRLDGQGRVAVIEMMVNTPAVGNLIREGKTFQLPSAIQTGLSQGMIPYSHSIEELVRKGLISKAQGDQFLGKKPKNENLNSTLKLAPTPPPSAKPRTNMNDETVVTQRLTQTKISMTPGKKN